MKSKSSRARSYIAVGLLILSAGSMFLLFCRFFAAQNLRYGFFGWNLFLAWVPLVCAVWLHSWLRTNRWVSWQGIALSIVWLAFLPNSFYLVSDIIHLKSTGEVTVLFDAVLFMLFALNGIILGFVALRIVHEELLERLPRRQVWAIVGFILFLCSFAIYLGRVQRWNSWDILLNPAGLLLDVSDNLFGGSQGANIFTTTAMFFVMCVVAYVGLYKLVEGIRELPEK